MESRNNEANPNRRDFLHTGTAAGLTLLAGASSTKTGESAENLPQVKLGDHSISRLIIGSNPMLGYSHMTNLVSKMMEDFYTIDKMVEVLRYASGLGINTFQSSYNEKLDQALKAFREQGGDIQWVCLASSELLDHPEKMSEVLTTLKPVAVAHHGWITDRLYRQGNINRVKEFVKKVRDLGSLAGISTHNPEILRHLESNNWDCDFYMASFHYISRSDEELVAKLGQLPIPKREVYLEEDPPAICEAIREVSKPVLVYKILAAGRYCNSPQDVENRFKYAFENIKPTDAVIVGIFPKYTDQTKENVEYTKKYG